MRPFGVNRVSATASKAKIAVIAAAVFVGCDIFDPSDCTAVGGYGLQIAVSDSVLGTPPLVPIVVEISDASYSETLSGPDSTNAIEMIFFGARERTGTYSVTVAAEGYSAWSRNDVEVRRAGSCDQIQLTRLAARLRRP